MTTRARRLLLLMVLALSLGAGSTSLTVAQEATPAGADGADEVTVLPPDERVAGATLGEWSARWWQWAVSFPVDVNPGTDATGETCGYGQHGPVFFLPAGFSPEAVFFTCIVPAGVAVFVPIGGAECSTVEPPPYFGRDEAELRACAEAGADAYAHLTVSVNNRPIADIERYRQSSPLFTITFPADNVFDAPAGVAAAVADGYDVLLAPLPEGEHQIEIHAAVEIEGEMVLRHLRYQLIVEAPKVMEPEGTPDAPTPVATPET